MKRRNAFVDAIALAMVVVLGLASRRIPGLFPPILGKYPGDALWALMAFLGWGLVRPGWSTPRIACAALATCFAVEFSQLYQAPWINEIRKRSLGHLVLGSGFQWGDLVAYTIGVVVGVMAERVGLSLGAARRRDQERSLIR